MTSDRKQATTNGAAVLATETDWTALYRRKRSRMGDPLAYRRVRLQDGREGTINRASHYGHGYGDERREDVFLGVTLDEKKWRELKSGSGYWMNTTWTGVLSDVELLDALPMTAPVRVRHVMHRGTKEQIAQRWASLTPLSDAQREAGCDRYVEFQPDVAAYRRWRIVSVAPAMEQDEVDALPSEHPRAVAERSGRADYNDDPMSGW